jgi:aspartate racemase
VARESPIPLLSIVEAAGEAAADLGLGTVGLLGTRFTMQGRFYPEVFARRGIAIQVPSSEDQGYVHDTYMRELISGEFRPETRERFLAIVERLERSGAQGVLLAGTELPMLLRDAATSVPLLDTTQIHVRKAVAALR